MTPETLIRVIVLSIATAALTVIAIMNVGVVPVLYAIVIGTMLVSIYNMYHIHKSLKEIRRINDSME